MTVARLYSNWNIDDNRLNVNGNNLDDNRNSYAFGIALASKIYNMKTYDNVYKEIISFKNLILAWKKARKGKTKKLYVIEFEKDLFCNLMALHHELKYRVYAPKPLEEFIIRDPKTRRIHKSDFRDRIVHHALCNVMESIFDKTFIYDSCANRIGKGTLFALLRFEKFRRKLTKNFTSSGYCLKADIKHYFQEVDHETLMNIIKKKITDSSVLHLIEKINTNFKTQRERELSKGMPLGNLTSQFFANVYLNEFDYFVKHVLRAKYYIRYVDDFILLHESKEQLEKWKIEIDKFLKEKLKLELHKDKSKIYPLSKGVDFVGFRNFYYFSLLRKRNLRKMKCKVQLFSKGELNYRKLMESFEGWQAYAKWADSYELRKEILKEIQKAKRKRHDIINKQEKLFEPIKTWLILSSKNVFK